MSDFKRYTMLLDKEDFERLERLANLEETHDSEVARKAIRIALWVIDTQEPDSREKLLIKDKETGEETVLKVI